MKNLRSKAISIMLRRRLLFDQTGDISFPAGQGGGSVVVLFQVSIAQLASCYNEQTNLAKFYSFGKHGFQAYKDLKNA